MKNILFSAFSLFVGLIIGYQYHDGKVGGDTKEHINYIANTTYLSGPISNSEVLLGLHNEYNRSLGEGNDKLAKVLFFNYKSILFAENRLTSGTSARVVDLKEKIEGFLINNGVTSCKSIKVSEIVECYNNAIGG